MRKSSVLIGASSSHGQSRHRLTDVAIILDDLRHGEALQEKLVPMQDGALFNLGLELSPSRRALTS